MPVEEVSRPHLKKEWEGAGKTLRIILPEGVFVIPHDTLLDWVRTNKNALNTDSWLGDRGEYHWPNTPADMLDFLRPFKER